MSVRSGTMANKVYKYVHKEDVWIQTNLTGRSYSNDWIEFESNGKFTLKGTNWKGYAWDGCSPKKNWLHFIFGTPDGKLDFRTEKPITYYASMIHDVIYQFKGEINISRKEADAIFLIILKESRFIWKWVYYLGVRVGGGFYGKWNSKKSQFPLNISGFSWLNRSNNSLTIKNLIF